MSRPLELVANALRRAIADQQVTRAELENLRQLARHALDHDTSTADEVRAALRWALDTDRPDARSFQTDSGIGASRAR